MLLDQMTAHQSANGQISHAPEDQPTTARKKRAGQTDLPITTHVVQIQEVSVSRLLVPTVLGNHALQELTDLLLTDHTQTEELVEEATTVQSVHQIVQHVQTPTVLGNHVHLAPTDHHLTETIQTEELAEEAMTVQIAPRTDQHVQTQTVRGNHALQELIAQSAQVTHVVLHLVQTLASLIVTATLSARIAFREIVQEMTVSMALATGTQTRRHSSRTRF